MARTEADKILDEWIKRGLEPNASVTSTAEKELEKLTLRQAFPGPVNPEAFPKPLASVQPGPLPEPFQRSLPGIGRVPAAPQASVVPTDTKITRVNNLQQAKLFPFDTNLSMAERPTLGAGGSSVRNAVGSFAEADAAAAAQARAAEEAIRAQNLKATSTLTEGLGRAGKEAGKYAMDPLELSTLKRGPIGQAAVDALAKVASNPIGKAALKGAAGLQWLVGKAVLPLAAVDLLTNGFQDDTAEAKEEEKIAMHNRAYASANQAKIDAEAARLAQVVSVPFATTPEETKTAILDTKAEAVAKKPANAKAKDYAPNEVGGRAIGWLPAEKGGDQTVQTFGNIKIVPMPNGTREVRIYDQPQVSMTKAAERIIAPETSAEPKFDLGTELKRLDAYEAEEKVQQAILTQANIQRRMSSIEQRILKAAEDRAGMTSAKQFLDLNNQLDSQYVGKTLQPGQTSQETLVAQQQFNAATEVAQRIYKGMLTSDPEYAAMKAGHDAVLQMANLGANRDIKKQTREEQKNQERARIPDEAVVNYRAYRGIVQDDSLDRDAIIKLPANDKVSQTFLYATKSDLARLLADPDPKVRAGAVQWANNIEKIWNGKTVNDAPMEHLAGLAKIAANPDEWLKANNPKLHAEITKKRTSDAAYLNMSPAEKARESAMDIANGVKITMENIAIAKASDMAVWPTVMPDSPLGKIVAEVKKDSKNNQVAPMDIVISRYMEADINKDDGTPMTSKEKVDQLTQLAKDSLLKISEKRSMIAPDPAVLHAAIMENVKLKAQRMTVLQNIRKQAGEFLTTALTPTADQNSPFGMIRDYANVAGKVLTSPRE